MTFLLTGNRNQPNFYSIFECREDTLGSRSANTYPEASTLTKLSCVPLVSTGIGIARALLGIAYTIKHLALAIFKQNRESDLKKALVGLKTVGRGALETIPIIGNLAIVFLLNKDVRRYENAIDAQYNNNKDFFLNSVTLFHDDKMIAKMPIDQFRQHIVNGYSVKEKARIISLHGVAL